MILSLVFQLISLPCMGLASLDDSTQVDLQEESVIDSSTENKDLEVETDLEPPSMDPLSNLIDETDGILSEPMAVPRATEEETEKSTADLGTLPVQPTTSFSIKYKDIKLLDLSKKLLRLKEYAIREGNIPLAKQIEQKYNDLLIVNLELHQLPEEFELVKEVNMTEETNFEYSKNDLTMEDMDSSQLFEKSSSVVEEVYMSEEEKTEKSENDETIENLQSLGVSEEIVPEQSQKDDVSIENPQFSSSISDESQSVTEEVYGSLETKINEYFQDKEYDFNKLEAVYHYWIEEFLQQLSNEGVEGERLYQANEVGIQSTMDLLLNTPIDVNLPAGQSQVYRFTPTNTGTHKIFTGPYGGTGSSNDTVLELYSDANLTQRIAYNDDANGTSFSEIILGLTSGVSYYVKLRTYSASDAVHARLTATYVYVSPVTISLNTPIDVDIPQGEYKVYKFTPSTPDFYRIFTDYYGGSSSNGSGDTILYLYSDENLTKLIGANDDYNGTSFSEIKREMPAGTSYYIKLMGYNGERVRTRITVTKAVRNFVDLQMNNPIDVSIPVYEYGYYRFTPTASGNYRIYTGLYGGTGQQYDTVLYLYSDATLLNRLTYNDDANSTPYSEIKWEMKAGVTYYIKLGGYAGGSVKARLSVGQLNSSYEYGYDDDGRLVNVLQNGIPVFQLVYDNNGNLLSKRRPSQ